MLLDSPKERIDQQNLLVGHNLGEHQLVPTSGWFCTAKTTVLDWQWQRPAALIQWVCMTHSMWIQLCMSRAVHSWLMSGHDTCQVDPTHALWLRLSRHDSGQVDPAHVDSKNAHFPPHCYYCGFVGSVSIGLETFSFNKLFQPMERSFQDGNGDSFWQSYLLCCLVEFWIHKT